MRTSSPVNVTVAGVRYRVFDATMHRGEMPVANPPAAWATFRVFRPEVDSGGCTTSNRGRAGHQRRRCSSSSCSQRSTCRLRHSIHEITWIHGEESAPRIRHTGISSSRRSIFARWWTSPARRAGQRPARDVVISSVIRPAEPVRNRAELCDTVQGVDFASPLPYNTCRRGADRCRRSVRT